MASSNSNGGVHILVFPFPAQGHILPLLDLTHHLSLRGISITILITPKSLPTLTPLLSSNPSIQTLTLPFPPHPSLPQGVETVAEIGNRANIPIIAALAALRDPIFRWCAAHPNPPAAILSDFFLGWTHHLAADLKIPRLAFYSSGAFVAAIFDRIWGNFDSLEPDEIEVKFDDLPRSPSFPWHQLPSIFRRCKDSECTDKTVAEFIAASMAANSLSWASIYNTFWALEDEFLGPKTGRNYSVGPLTLVNGSGQLRPGGGSGRDVASWLDACDDGSVLYACFGSQKTLSADQSEALGAALEASGVRYVWAAGKSSMPDGFEERASGRGLVVKGWAPQTEILGHRAVGGFLSHCGWNSTMEAIAAGVAVLAWPMEADQFANARLLVEYAGAAVLVCEGAETVPDPAGLARRFREWKDGCAAERGRARDLRKQALEAVEAGGSSIADLDRLAEELLKL